MESIPPEVAAHLPSIPHILGGLIIGIGVGLVLYGVTVTQAYIYMLNCEHDPLWMKILVVFIAVAETLHTAFIFRELWSYSVDAIGNPLTIQRVDWSIGTSLLSSNIIAALVEGFYIRRQWILGKSYVLTIVTSFLLLSRTVFHVVVSVETFIYPTWDEFRNRVFLNALVKIVLALEAAVDAVLAISMVYFLRRETGSYTGARGIITWMMVYAVHSGLVLMAASLVVLITFVTMKDSLVFAGIIAIIGKLYSNSLLGTLNARQVLRSKNTDPIVKHSSVSTGSRNATYELSGFHQRSLPPQGLRIDITHETTRVLDKRPEDLKSTIPDLDP